MAEPIWDKEDAERAEQGLPPRFEKYSDNKQTRNYVRARYKEDPITKELTMDPKTRALELVLAKDTESSSAGSSQSSPFETPLNRALT